MKKVPQLKKGDKWGDYRTIINEALEKIGLIQIQERDFPATHFMTGSISIEESIGHKQEAEFEVSLNGVHWVTPANLQAWIDSNTSGTRTRGTKWFIRTNKTAKLLYTL